MKKVSLLAAALLTAGTMAAQFSFQGLPGAQRVPQQMNVTPAEKVLEAPTSFTGLGARVTEAIKTNLTEGRIAPVKTSRRGAAPDNIIGKSYNTFFSSFTDYGNASAYFTVEQGTGDTVVLKGLAQGYDVKGVWNKAAGTVTCPSSQVIGTHSTLGTVTFYTLSGTQYSRVNPLVITFDTEAAPTFNYGIYAAVSAGGVAMMKDDITCVESNGILKLKQTDQAGTTVNATYELPIYITKESASKMYVQGMQTWLYGHNYKVPFTIVGNKATLATTDSLDWCNSSSGIQCYFMLSFNGSSLSYDPTFTVTTENGNTVLTADTPLFAGYNTEGTNWRGYFLRDYVMTVNGDNGGGGDDKPAGDIIGKRYNTFYSSFTNYTDPAIGYFTVLQGEGDTVILKGIADGYDLKGIYNKAAGTVTVPTGQSMGQFGNYGELVIYTFLAPGYTQFSRTEPVVITFGEDGEVTFNNGFYGAVSAGGVVYMKEISVKEANGSVRMTQFNGSTIVGEFDMPAQIVKTADNTFTVQGISQFMYHGNFEVPFTYVESSNTATLLSTSQVDYNGATAGVQNFFMLTYNGSGLQMDPTFTIKVAGDSTVVTADSQLFMGYNTSGTNWSGFFLKDVKIIADFDIYKAEVTAGDPTTATVDGIYYSLDNETLEATVTGCEASLTYLNIPNTISANSKTFNVVAVAEAAFQANGTITRVNMPKSIKTVETDAFRNLKVLARLDIEDLASWCGISFANGNANPLYNVFPTSTANWGKVYINGNEVTTTLAVPEGVTSIVRSFYGFKSLTSVTLPSTLTVLGDQAFANCINLPTVEIPTSVVTMGSSFFGCSGLTSIEVPAGVTSLASTFYGCSKLTDVKLNEGLTTIGSLAFCNNTSLTAIELPSTVTSVASTSFMSDANLKVVTCKAVTPPTAGTGAFEDFAETCELIVPTASVDAYKAANEWKTFYKITDAVQNIEVDDNAPAVYYNINGYKVNSENLAPGLYIKVQGNKATRVLVK